MISEALPALEPRGAVRPRRSDELQHRRLPDHTIRRYRQSDLGLIPTLSDGLSAGSLYHRFFVGTPRIPLYYLRSLKAVDHGDREVLLALREDVHVIAIAEYTRDASDPRTADLALLIADAWQRRGLAGPLIDALGEIALSRGITRFRADVLPGNKAAQAAIHRHRPGSPCTHGPGGLKEFLLEARPGAA